MTLAAGIYPSIAALRGAPAPFVQTFARVLGGKPAGLFVYQPGSTSITDDGWSTIIPSNPQSGGGAWLMVPEDDRGLDLTAANGFATSGAYTLGIYSGPWLVLPAATLTGGLSITLDPNNKDGNIIPRGSVIEFTRLDLGAYTVAILNGGGAGGTLCTLPVSTAAYAKLWFDGVNWGKRDAHTML
jgi:hypothetical protein